jgi:hypothetical protein
MTGARIMTTLLNNLDALDGTIGLETMCVAGGMGQAMLVERLNCSSRSARARTRARARRIGGLGPARVRSPAWTRRI